MSSDAKVKLVKAIVVKSFKAGKSIDEICEAVMKTGKLNFTEIGPVVKFIGSKEGFITSTKDKQAAATKMLDELDNIEFADYTAMMATIAKITLKTGAATSWVTRELTKAIRKEELTVPQKSSMNGWRAAAYECFKRDKTASQHDMFVAIQKDTKNPKPVVTKYYELFSKLAAL